MLAAYKGIAVLALALFLAALLQAEGLRKQAEIQPSGFQRDLALRVTKPLASFSRAGDVLVRLFDAWGQSSPLVTTSVVLAILAGIVAQYIRPRAVTSLVGSFQRLPVVAQSAAVAVALTLINTLGPTGVAPFIYFRF